VQRALLRRKPTEQAGDWPFSGRASAAEKSRFPWKRRLAFESLGSNVMLLPGKTEYFEGATALIRLVKAAMAEASEQATSPKRKQLRNVMTGQSLCAAAPLRLSPKVEGCELRWRPFHSSRPSSGLSPPPR